MKRIIIFFAIALSIVLEAQFEVIEEPIKLKGYPSKIEAKQNETLTYNLEFNFEPSWHIYSHFDKESSFPLKISFDKNENFIFSEIKYPKGVAKTLLGSNHLFYEEQTEIPIEIKVKDNAKDGKYNLVFSVTYQGCNDEQCLMPMTKELELEVIVGTGAVKEEKTPVKEDKTPVKEDKTPVKEDKTPVKEDKTSEDDILSKGLFLSFLTAFIWGIFTSLTPCVYPMIPITIGFFVGQSKSKSKLQILTLAFVFVLGIATLYSIIGVFTAIFKQSFNVLLESKIVIGVLASIFFLLGLSLFGLFQFKLPNFITKKARVSKGGYFGAFFRGFFLGIVAAPCMGPGLLAILPLVPNNPIIGALLLFVYALGIGVLFIVLAMFAGILPKSGGWLHSIEIFLGIVIILLSLYFFNMLLPLFVTAIIIGILLILFAVYLLWNKIKHKEKNLVKVMIAILSVILGLVFLGGFLINVKKEKLPVYILKKVLFYGDWEKDHDASIERAKIEKKPVIIDVWAEWCVPCRVMDGTVFRDENILKELNRFVKIKIDLTSKGKKEEELVKKYKILGPPTFIFYNSNGELLENKTIQGKIDAESLLKILKDIH